MNWIEYKGNMYNISNCTGIFKSQDELKNKIKIKSKMFKSQPENKLIKYIIRITWGDIVYGNISTIDKYVDLEYDTEEERNHFYQELLNSLNATVLTHDDNIKFY